MTTLYTAHATATNGRNGHAETDDKKISVSLSAPGGNGAGTNPEQLFACGYGACFGSAIEAVSKKQGVKLSEIIVKVDVSLNQDDSGYFIAAGLNVSLPGIDKTQAEQIVQAAHQICPYSKATRGNINVKLTVDGQSISQAA